MLNLPKKFVGFILWWLVKAPKSAFTIAKRVFVLVDSRISLTLNVRLIFTPLFGDYTIIGRGIGFCIRVVEILAGLVFMSVLSIIVLITPLAWWALPYLAYIKLGTIGLLVFPILGILWYAKTLNIPGKRVVDTESKDDYLKAMQLKTRLLLKNLQKHPKSGMPALLKQKEIPHLLKKAELDLEKFREKILGVPNIDTENIIAKCFEYAKEHSSRYIETEHLFLTVMPKGETLLSSLGTSLENLEKTAKWVVQEREKLSQLYIWQEDYELVYTGGFGKGMLGRTTPTLDSMSTDFTKEAKEGRLKKIVGREKEMKRIAEILSGSKENILITGEAGSGKTTIVRGLAHKIMEGTEYKSLKNKRLVSLDVGSLIAGTTSSGKIAEKLKGAIEDVKGSGDIILFIDEIHNVVAGTDDKNAVTSTVFTTLEPYLASGEIQFIGATTLKNYRKFIEPNGAFARLFQMVAIDEASDEDAIEILKHRAKLFERKYKVFITYPALEKTVTLSKKLIHERVLPDKAIDILSRSVTRVSENTKLVTSAEVAKEIAEMTKVPVEAVSQDEASKLLNIENEMRQMVVGQDHALKQISAALKRARVGMRDEGRPIASFLFVGTTGVGKTQTAKALAKSYFGDKKAMIRLDMSEYQQIDSLSRLIGTPDGETRGILTDKVRSKPFALILLDEIEKAHSNILHTFLQVLDEGRLTDSSGTVVDFTNTIIIATSNVGTRSIQDIFTKGGNFEEMKKAAGFDVREHFAPEFLNRFSGIIVFNPLTQKNLRKITYLLLSDVEQSAKQKNIKLIFKEELVDELIKRGYNPKWGARPLARIIEDTIESFMATKMLTDEIKQGDEVSLGLEVFEGLESI